MINVILGCAYGLHNIYLKLLKHQCFKTKISYSCMISSVTGHISLELSGSSDIFVLSCVFEYSSKTSAKVLK